MKEHDFIKIIKEQTDNSFIGDDCAYLKELGIVITQDNFIEDVHFKTEWATPFQIGYKAAAVNISDVLASGAKPAYLSVGLSLPSYVNNDFISELYCGIKKGAFGAEVIGGDITGGDKIFISITAIGKTEGRKISSRKNAKEGFVIITKGIYGESSKGLSELQAGRKSSSAIRAHLEPILDVKFSEDVSTHIQEEYAMMDTSDGLADALFQIAKASEVTIHSNKICGMFGAEDYNLVAAVPEEFAKTLNNINIIGKVTKYKDAYLIIDNKKYNDYNDLNLYNHFK
ncbi:MAG: hypothetical protein E7Z92_02840 [Cyanobacteria bacterium SIG31]|nr:hypothetical protein [Cyanobacteria bacterium SIG31]